MRIPLLILLIARLHAAPIGNPSLPYLLEKGFFIPDTCWTNFQAGFVGDCLISKKMKVHSSRMCISGFSESGLLIWNIQERFNFQLELGSGQYSWKFDDRSGKSSGGLLGSADAKLIIFHVKDLTFALDAQVGGWQHSRLLLRYWQLGPAFTYKMGIFSPYIGCAINRMRSKLSTSTGTFWPHERHHVGPFGGCSISNGNRYLANLEWRGCFEDGVTFSAQVRF